VRDLNDPDNPYRGQYEEWDIWTYEHVRGTTNTDVSNWYRGESPDDYCMLTIRVDTEGNVVPLRLSTADDLAIMHDPNYSPETDCRFSLRGGGVINPRLLDKLDEMLIGLRMPYAPAVPEWLAKAPPERVMFMPDGDLVCIGEPDPDRRISHRPNTVPAEATPTVTRRYDREGKLLAETAPGDPWFTVYFTGFADILAEMQAGNYSYWEYGGYIVFNDSQTRSIAAIYDYDGTEIAVDTQLNWYEARFEVINGAELPVIHRLQSADK